MITTQPLVPLLALLLVPPLVPLLAPPFTPSQLRIG